MLAKDIERITYEMILLPIEVYVLWAANEALSERHKAKKTYIHEGDILKIEDTQDILI